MMTATSCLFRVCALYSPAARSASSGKSLPRIGNFSPLPPIVVVFSGFLWYPDPLLLKDLTHQI